MQRLAPLGFSSARRRNELDCHLRHELDDDGLFQQSLRPPLRKRDRGAWGSDVSACAARLGNYADILVDSVLDVPPEDLPENLSRYRVLAPEFACRSEFPNYSSHSAPKLAEGGVHEITVRKSATLSLLPLASFILSFIL